MDTAALAPTQSVSLRPNTSPRGIKKVLSNRSRTSIQDGASEAENAQLALSQSHTSQSAGDQSPISLARKPSRDGSTTSGSSGIRKLIPGHAGRKKRRLRAQDIPGLLYPGSEHSDTASAANTSITTSNHLSILGATSPNKSATSLLPDDTSLLTDDSEASSPGSRSRPALVSHESHSGYLAHSSPLINTTEVGRNNTTADPEKRPPSSQQEQQAAVPDIDRSRDRPKPLLYSPSLPTDNPLPNLSSPTLADRASTLGPPSESLPGRRKSMGQSVRGIASGRRKLKEALQTGRSSRSPRASPERDSFPAVGTLALPAQVDAKQASLSSRRKSPLPSPIQTDSTIAGPHQTKTSVVATDTPQTPLSTESNAPSTTVTPPTPIEGRSSLRGSPTRSPDRLSLSNGSGSPRPNSSAGASTHRRARSGSGSLHQPSRLSNAISAPLTPTIEEVRTPSTKSESRTASQTTGFFSTWVSAAQNAATTLTNTLNTQNNQNNQNKPRAVAETATPETARESAADSESPPSAAGVSGASETELAIETLGAGDLKLSHLGIAAESRESLSRKSAVPETHRQTAIRRDEAAAKIEDMLAKRAVSAAYEKPSEDSSKTPVAEMSDPINSLRQTSTFSSNALGDLQTTPNGSVVDGDSGSVKRNNSVRSRLTERRKRGNSNATGASSVGTILGPSTTNLVNSAGASKMTLAVAPRSRNRTFHQLFRSVPDDDFLIEDYSCALQKEILLAGRIYVSEGHICFSSNILGWVTTLVISFEEVMAIERETTAMVFPNAIAIQTLHARHLFRSLLSREATFDLIMGIWKQSHPAAFKKSVVGTAAVEEVTDKLDQVPESDSDSDDGSEDADEVYDEDEDAGADSGSVAEAVSFVGSDMSDVAAAAAAVAVAGPRKASALGGPAAVTSPTNAAATPGDGQATEKAIVAASAATADFPGPATHAATDCTDSTTHYDKVLKDENIPAPLGKIYSMLFGPTSGVFLTKYLVDEQRVTELQYEDDKKGLGDQNRSRSYSYIKPLYGAIGPRQTKCITTETLDFFDLERSVSVTCSTQTPDVPNGNMFSVKTRYCLSWAPGNATRLQMNCTIEWTGKSWLKSPIEKGATDGQQTYGNELIKALKVAMSSRTRSATAGSKGLKSGRRKKRADRNLVILPKSELAKQVEPNWGLLEPFRGVLGPFVDILAPFSGTLAVATILLLLSIVLFRRPAGHSADRHRAYSNPARLLAYEELWHNEEGELWAWLDERIGMEGLALHETETSGKDKPRRPMSHEPGKQRQRILGSKKAETRLRGEQMSEREMDDAIRVTEERLDVLKRAVKKSKSVPDDGRM